MDYLRLFSFWSSFSKTTHILDGLNTIEVHLLFDFFFVFFSHPFHVNIHTHVHAHTRYINKLNDSDTYTLFVPSSLVCGTLRPSSRASFAIICFLRVDVCNQTLSQGRMLCHSKNEQ